MWPDKPTYKFVREPSDPEALPSPELSAWFLQCSRKIWRFPFLGALKTTVLLFQVCFTGPRILEAPIWPGLGLLPWAKGSKGSLLRGLFYRRFDTENLLTCSKAYRLEGAYKFA